MWRRRDQLENWEMTGHLTGLPRARELLDPTNSFNAWIRRTLSPQDAMSPEFTAIELEQLGDQPPIEMISYAKGTIQPRNATLVVVGPTSSDWSQTLAESYFGEWSGKPGGEPIDQAEPPSPFQVSALGLFDVPSSPVAIVRTECALTPTLDQYWERETAARIIEISATRHLQDLGLASSVWANAQQFGNGQAVVTLVSRVDVHRAPEAIEQLWAAMDGLERAEVSDSAVRAAALQVAATIPLSMQTQPDRLRAMRRGIVFGAGDPVAFFSQGAESLAQADAAGISSVMAGCSTSRVTGVIGPSGLLAEPLGTLGLDVVEVDWLTDALAELKQADNKTGIYFRTKRAYGR